MVVPAKKDKLLRKERYLRVRLTESQWELLHKAAEADALTVSGWARSQLMALARKRVGHDE